MSDSSPGQIIGGIVGATAGFFLGGPVGALKGFSVGYTIGGAVDPPPGPTVEGPRLSDLKAQTSNYGAPIPIVYGRNRIAGNIIWVQGNSLIERRNVTEQEGGKGGGGGSEVISYEYYATFAVAVCEGPVTGIRRIWADSVLIYDNGPNTTVSGVIAGARAASGITIYDGSSTQAPNELIEADVGTAPAFRGVCYVVFERMALEKFGNRIPNMSFEVVDGEFDSTLIQSAFVTTETRTDAADAYFAAPSMVDPFGRAVFFLPGYSTSYENDLVTPVVVYPNGTEVIGTQVDIGVNRGFGSQNPCQDEADDFLLARSTDGVTQHWRVFRYDISDDTMTAMAYYKLVYSSQIGDDSYFCQRGDKITVHNTLDASVHVGLYPEGTLAEPHHMPVVLLSDDVSGQIIGHTHDGTTCWIITDAPELHAVDLESLTVQSTVTLARSYTTIRYDISTGILYAQSADEFYELDPTTGNETLKIDTNLGATNREAWSIRSGILHVVSEPGASSVSRWYRFDSLDANTVSLSSVLSDLCTRSGLAAGDIDTAAITDSIKGFTHSKPGPASASMTVLALSYQFDAIESGYKIKFVPRGQASVVTLTTDDLAAHEHGQDRPEEFIQSYERTVALPRRVDVSFIDPARDYDIGQQYAERIETESVGVRQLSLSVLLTDDEAAQIAEILLWRAWLERQAFEFVLPVKYSYLEPGDTVTLSLDDGSLTLRLASLDMGSPGLVKCQATADLPEIYSSAAAGGATVAADQNVKLIGATNIKFIDTALLRDADNDAGFYYAAGGEAGTDWPGAVLMQSNDGGENFYRIDAAVSEATIGVTTDALPDGETGVFDYSSTVNVRITNDLTLSSSTETAVLNGANTAVIGAHGRWEVVKFVTATLESDGTYTLSDFIRGHRGTEWATDTHQVGDAFVLMNETTSNRYEADESIIDAERHYKAVTFGTNVMDAATKSFTNSAAGLKPYSPVEIAGSRDGSNNLTITFTRRSRIGNGWRDYVEVPLGEASESYEIDIHSDDTTVVRTLTSTSPTVSYTAAQQTTDFGSPQSSILVKVYQMSDVVGRGYAGVETV